MSPIALRIVRLVTFTAIVLAILSWILTIIGWLVTEPGFEPLNVLASAVLSSLLALFGWLRTRPSRKDGPSESSSLDLELVVGDLRQFLNELKDNLKRIQQAEQVEISRGSQIISRWWFSSQFLDLDLDFLQEVHTLLRDYRRLPRFPGCASTLQQYVDSRKLTSKINNSIRQLGEEIERLQSHATCPNNRLLHNVCTTKGAKNGSRTPKPL